MFWNTFSGTRRNKVSQVEEALLDPPPNKRMEPTPNIARGNDRSSCMGKLLQVGTCLAGGSTAGRYAYTNPSNGALNNDY